MSSKSDIPASQRDGPDLYVVKPDVAKPDRRSDLPKPRGEGSDGELLQQIAGGNEDAFEALFHRYYGRIRGYLLRLLGREDLAEELTSDVLVTIWQKASSFEGRSRPSTWILGIAYRKGMQALRKLLAQPPSVSPDELDSGQLPRARDEASRRLLLDTLRSAMECLSPEQRAVVQFTYVYGFSYAEIGMITGVPVNTVKTRMFYARRRLRDAWPVEVQDQSGAPHYA